MAEMPRIVRERLREQTAGGEHPDANMLSGFTEQALSEGESAQVLEHVSRCEQCRDVVALAQLPVEELQPGGAFVPSRSWWRSPVVHWSALITAAVVVLIAVAMHPHRQRPGLSASAPAVSEPASSGVQAGVVLQGKSEAATAPAVMSNSRTPKKEGTTAKEWRGTPEGMQPKSAKSKPSATSATTDKFTLGGSRSGNISSAPGYLPPLPPVRAPVGQQPDSSAGSQDSATVHVQSQAAAPEMKGGSMGMKDSGSVQAGYAGGVAAAAPAPKSETAILNKSTGRSLALRASLSPRWSISDSGALQRSFDGGRSWTGIDVAQGVTFRAVATVGSDIWAGGGGGALYHSSDSGESWSRVQVRDRAKNRNLTGDIVHIEFVNPNDGSISTSTGQVWTTTFGGTIWRLERESLTFP